jgi:hypothetical protein
MTIDPESIQEIACVCEALSTSASTAEGHDMLAKLTLSWLRVAFEKRSSAKRASL